jgi:hypothetical protein
MNLKTGLSALAFAAAVALGGQAAAATTVTSTFDTGADGWAFGTYQGVGSAQPVTYDPQAQLISKTHGFGGFGFVAPLKYLGDKSEFIGGALSFDLSSVLQDYKTQSLVAFTGGNGQTIFSRLIGPPGSQLQAFTIGLTAASFYTGAPSQVTGAVSAAKFEAIMGDLEQIEIFGDWGNNVDTVSLDNVSMAGAAAVPEPATWAMMILGFGLTGALMRRRRETAFA